LATNRESALEVALIGVLAAADLQGVDVRGLANHAKELISLYPGIPAGDDGRSVGAAEEVDKAVSVIEEGKRASEVGNTQ